MNIILDITSEKTPMIIKIESRHLKLRTINGTPYSNINTYNVDRNARK